MFDIKLADGKKVLIIELNDLSKRIRIGNIAEKAFMASMAYFQVILVLVSPSLGIKAIPKWMRDHVRMGILRPQKGDFGSCYIMELGPDQTWIKEG